MTNINLIIDAIGDRIFTPTVTTNNRTRLEQVLHENQRDSFEDTLFKEQKIYEKKYTFKKEELRKALVNRDLLKIKEKENTKLIKTLANEIKGMNYKPYNNSIIDEVEMLIST
tara:strand:- start:1785 stop:2123 length:339 start_codon:yes stop_codon:yes gene_type:complete